MNKEALLNVARACRESPHPDKFTMSRVMHDCGTPACAFGNYAARQDLQSEFMLLNPKTFTKRDGTVYVWACDGVATLDGYQVTICSPVVERHFDLDSDDLDELFEVKGCGKALTPNEAAAYIEKFVAERS